MLWLGIIDRHLRGRGGAGGAVGAAAVARADRRAHSAHQRGAARRDRRASARLGAADARAHPEQGGRLERGRPGSRAPRSGSCATGSTPTTRGRARGDATWPRELREVAAALEVDHAGAHRRGRGRRAGAARHRPSSPPPLARRCSTLRGTPAARCRFTWRAAPGRADVFVRDRGPGFDVDALPEGGWVCESRSSGGCGVPAARPRSRPRDTGTEIHLSIDVPERDDMSDDTDRAPPDPSPSWSSTTTPSSGPGLRADLDERLEVVARGGRCGCCGRRRSSRRGPRSSCSTCTCPAARAAGERR